MKPRPIPMTSFSSFEKRLSLLNKENDIKEPGINVETKNTRRKPNKSNDTNNRSPRVQFYTIFIQTIIV